MDSSLFWAYNSTNNNEENSGLTDQDKSELDWQILKPKRLNGIAYTFMKFCFFEAIILRCIRISQPSA